MRLKINKVKEVLPILINTFGNDKLAIIEKLVEELTNEFEKED